MNKLGLGIYSLGEAARLIHAERRSLRRWMCGYDYRLKSGDELRHSPPLWKSQYSNSNLGECVIGFQDLLELRIVREFVQHGVPLIVVRRCLERAAEIFAIEFPFTTRRFATDGRTIYTQALHEASEGELLDLRTNQYAFREIIKPSLYSGIEYEGEHARRWYPNPRRKDVVIDPEIQLGKPIIARAGVPTAALYASYLAAGRDKRNAATEFDVSIHEVDAAVAFEERLAA